MPPELSPLTQQLVEKLFEPGSQAAACRLLVDECGHNLPFCKEQDAQQMERIRFAALRLGRGSLEDLSKAIHYAKSDWRDVLVWAGFGERLAAHQAWAQEVMRGNNETGRA